ncbi:hypothetical protein Chor_008316 [Crotalus horridus]
MLLRDPPATLVSPWERGVVLLSCALSVLGCCLLLGTQARWPELRTRPRQLLSCLSVADLLSAASYAYGVLKDFEASSWDCVAQGALSTFANTSSFFWTVAIALDLYFAIVRGSPGSASLLSFFHLVSWGVPLGITAAAVALKKIGYDASDVSVGWCWIDINAEDRLLWMLLAGKLWEILAYHTALSEYRPILSRAPSSHPGAASGADKKLTLIPIVFIFLRVWSTIRESETLFKELQIAFSLFFAPESSGINSFRPCAAGDTRIQSLLRRVWRPASRLRLPFAKTGSCEAAIAQRQTHPALELGLYRDGNHPFAWWDSHRECF